jgi:hypothetical protein
MNHEEGFKRLIKNIGFMLMICFIDICICLAFFDILEHCTVNPYTYFVSGAGCCVVSALIFRVINTHRKKACERDEWNTLSKHAGRFTPEHLKKEWE